MGRLDGETAPASAYVRVLQYCELEHVRIFCRSTRHNAPKAGAGPLGVTGAGSFPQQPSEIYHLSATESGLRGIWCRTDISRSNPSVCSSPDLSGSLRCFTGRLFSLLWH